MPLTRGTTQEGDAAPASTTGTRRAKGGEGAGVIAGGGVDDGVGGGAGGVADAGGARTVNGIRAGVSWFP